MKKTIVLTPSTDDSKKITLTLTHNEKEKRALITIGESTVELVKSDFEKLCEEFEYLIEEF